MNKINDKDGALGIDNMELCPCGSKNRYEDCCGPIIHGDRNAATAEALMRARYSAYAKKEIEYLRESLHPATRADFDVKGTKEWADSAEWLGLDIIKVAGGLAEEDAGVVEFTAAYKEKGIKHKHHEVANFKKEDGIWYFVDENLAEKNSAVEKQNRPTQFVRATPKVGRNEPCACGSGKKFKKCCGQKTAK